jgi:hypothetical protein
MPDPEAQRMREQYAEAERLVREAQRVAEEAAGAPREVPPSGWSVPGDDAPPAPGGPVPFPDLAQLSALVESLRGVVPPELARQLADSLRELLIALRAVLDWYIARLEPPEPEARDVQDIPVD